METDDNYSDIRENDEDGEDINGFSDNFFYNSENINVDRYATVTTDNDDNDNVSKLGGGSIIGSLTNDMDLHVDIGADAFPSLFPFPLAELKPNDEQEIVDPAKLELDELYKNPFSYIRRGVRERVKDGIWLKDLKKVYDHLSKPVGEVGKDDDDEIMGKANIFSKYRCTICTLPYGTCKHTEKWINHKWYTALGKSQLNSEIDIDDPKHPKKSATDQEIDDVLGVIESVEIKLKTKTVEEDIDIDGLKWGMLESRLSDKIGGTYLSLSMPSERGWHTTITLDNERLVVVFGGFRFKKTSVPQPFDKNPKAEDVECLSDILIYDGHHSSWHTPRPVGKARPVGRYGHIAVALDANRMFIFGGRGDGGRLLNDSWVYNSDSMEWTPLPLDPSNPPPVSRVFASAATEGSNVYLFGGTDGSENFGDVWIFHGRPDKMFWERTVVVGPPPAPRYGHKLVFIRPGEMAVLGGCCVSPQSEVIGNVLSTSDTKKLLDLSSTLQRQYHAEGTAADYGGQTLNSNILQGERDLRGYYREAAGVAGRVQMLEQATRKAEQELVDNWQLSQASRFMKMQKARHPDANLDIFFLSTKDMIWRTQIYPQIKGEPPSCRMHFSSFCIGNYVLVVGGARPTSLHNSPVEQDHSRIYALDLVGLRWLQPHPIQSTEYFEIPLQIAKSDIIRAQKRVEVEKARGFALGARNGVTVERAEAEAVLEVCNWRLNALDKERTSSAAPPPGRWGGSLTKIKQRAFYIGGWTAEAVVSKKLISILNMEHEFEKRRREEDEFIAMLERNKSAEDARASMNDIQSAHELRQQILEERHNEAKERRYMSIEEIISTVPPLTKPPPIRLQFSNETTLWVEWDKVLTNADGRPINHSSITYKLFYRNGYRQLIVEDRVLVAPRSNNKMGAESAANAADGASMMSSIASYDSRDNRSNANYFNEDDDTINGNDDEIGDGEDGNNNDDAAMPVNVFRGTGYPGEIVSCSGNGFFDIAYDDGTIEKLVPRWRIALENPLEEFTAIESDKNGMSIKTSDRIKETMAIAAKRRIMKKLKRKTNLSKLLKLMHPNYIALKDRLKESRLHPPRYYHHQHHLVENDENDESSDSENDEEDEDLRSARQMQEDLIAIRKGTYKPPKGKKQEMTVKVPPGWSIIYIGNNLSYECHGLVPREVCLAEPNLTVQVDFVIQTVGREFPSYETSHLSEVATFWTGIPESNLFINNTPPLSLSYSPVPLTFDEVSSAAFTSIAPGSAVQSALGSLYNSKDGMESINTNNASTSANSNSSSTSKPTNAAGSKIKKEYLSAIVNDYHIVHLERQKYTISSDGVFDHFI